MGGDVRNLAEGKRRVAYRQRLRVLAAALQSVVAFRSRILGDTRQSHKRHKVPASRW